MASRVTILVEGGWLEDYQVKYLISDVEAATGGKVTSITRHDDTEFDLNEIRDRYL